MEKISFLARRTSFPPSSMFIVYIATKIYKVNNFLTFQGRRAASRVTRAPSVAAWPAPGMGCDHLVGDILQGPGIGLKHGQGGQVGPGGRGVTPIPGKQTVPV